MNECPFPLSRRAQKDLNHQITLQKKTKSTPRQWYGRATTGVCVRNLGIFISNLIHKCDARYVRVCITTHTSSKQ